MVTGHPSHSSNSSKNVAPGQGLGELTALPALLSPPMALLAPGTDHGGGTKHLLLSSRSSIGRTAI